MTESVRREIPFDSAGGSVDASPEQRMPEWEAADFDATDGPVGLDAAAAGDMPGIDPAQLPDEELNRELQSLHRTRLDTLRHATDSALATHLRRTAELETEYLARHPGREVDPSRLRDR